MGFEPRIEDLMLKSTYDPDEDGLIANPQLKDSMAVGVEWNQSTDTWTRKDIDGNTFASFPYSFDTLLPWSAIRRVTLLANGQVNEWGDGKGTGVTLGGTAGRVMVQIPKFWVKAESPSANVYRWWISPEPLPGFELHPAFLQRGGTVRDFIYIAAFEGDFEYDGDDETYLATHEKLHSRSGKQPYTGDADCIWEVDFDGGQNEPSIGDEMSTPTEGAFYLVDYVKTGGTWAGNDATGKLWIRKPLDDTCGWVDNENITNETQSNTLAGGAGLGVNGSPSGRQVTITHARTLASNIGGGWGLVNVWSYAAIQLLFYTEYAGANSEVLVGRGVTDKTAPGGYNGVLTGADSIDSELATNGTGTGTGVDGLTPIAYRGIENLWGNIIEPADGFEAVDAEFRVIRRDGRGRFGNPLGPLDYEASVAAPIIGPGYISNIAYEDLLKFLFMPSAAAGTATTYLFDAYGTHRAGETNILLDSAHWAHGDETGIGFRGMGHEVTNSFDVMGARLEFIGEPRTAGARVYHSLSQSIPNTTWTTLSFDSEDFDTDFIHDVAVNNTRLTCKTAGKYLAYATVWWTGDAAGTRLIRIRENGATTWGFTQKPCPANDSDMDLATVVDLDVGDYLELQVWQNSGGDLTIDSSGASFQLHFGMQRID